VNVVPKLYNIPDWYSPDYQRAMDLLVEAIRLELSIPPARDEVFLEGLRRAGDPESDANHRLLATGETPVWDGPG